VKGGIILLNFSFTEEQEYFRKMLKEFAREELLPNYTKWDREGIKPRHLWKKLGECLLFNGHYAYTKEMPNEQRLRDVIIIGKEYRSYSLTV
jgi:Acyl-CoA dehydrogenase, N-terminal domain